MTSQAELKDCKFREPLTGNADGNPEPSSENREGAETRHRLCVKCGNPIPLKRYKNAKYCSTKCASAQGSYSWRVRTGKIKNPGVGSGGNQWGTDNHMYKTGIGTFQKVAKAAYGEICNRCKSTDKIVVHHIDEDRKNNKVDNLEVLCKKCHQEHHCIRNEFGQFIKHT